MKTLYAIKDCILFMQVPLPKIQKRRKRHWKLNFAHPSSMAFLVYCYSQMTQSVDLTESEEEATFIQETLKSQKPAGKFNGYGGFTR